MKRWLLAALPIMALAGSDRPLTPVPPAPACADAPDSRAVALCLNRAAIAKEQAGDFRAAARDLEQAAALWPRDAALGPPLHAVILSNLGEAYEQLGKWPEAVTQFEEALAVQRSSLGADAAPTASSMLRLAAVRMVLGHPDKAEPLYRDGLAILRRNLPGSALELSLGLGSYALLQVHKGDLTEAITLARESVADAALNGTGTVGYASSLAILAGVYSLAGEMSRAAPLLSKAIDIFEQQLGPSHPRLSALLLNRAMVLAAQKKTSLAEADAKRAIDLLSSGMGAGSSSVAWAKVRLASIYLDEDKQDEADAILPEAVAIQRRLYSTPNTRLAAAVRELARLRAKQARAEEADELYREAISMFDAVAPSDPDAGRALHEYAALLKAGNGPKDEIRRLESRAHTILGARTSAF